MYISLFQVQHAEWVDPNVHPTFVMSQLRELESDDQSQNDGQGRQNSFKELFSMNNSGMSSAAEIL